YDRRDRALVLEVVQERRHPDGEEAHHQCDDDETDAYRPHPRDPAPSGATAPFRRWYHGRCGKASGFSRKYLSLRGFLFPGRTLFCDTVKGLERAHRQGKR